MPIQLKWRRDTSANWTSNNPVLADGEPGFETNTAKFKIGDGTTAWSSLSYYPNPTGDIDSLAMLFKNTSDPSAPASGKMYIYAKSIAGRMMLKQMDPSGQTVMTQPFFAGTKLGIWNPHGNSTVLPGVFGYTAPTTVGTTTAANVATTNFYTRLRRVQFLSVATAAGLASYRVAVAQLQLGDGQGNNGFHKIIRFGCSDPATVAGARQFCGISSNTAAPTNVEPSTLTNCIGVGHGAADTNLKIFYGGSVAQAAVDLGSNFPANTLSTDAYELALYSPPNAFCTVYYEVTRLNTGHVATGTIVGDGAGIVLPTPYLQLTNAWNYRTNNATALAVGLDIISDYFETDN